MNARKAFGMAWARLVSNQRPLACEASAVGERRQTTASPGEDLPAVDLISLVVAVLGLPPVAGAMFGQSSAKRRGLRLSLNTPRRGR